MSQRARPAQLQAVPRGAALRPRPGEPTPAATRAAAAVERALDAHASLVVLLGEAGSGKTSLLGRLREALGARGAAVLLAPVPADPEAVLGAMLTALGGPADGPRRMLRRRLDELVATGTGATVLVDDAHVLGDGVLRELVSLAAGGGRRALRLVLAGEPELAVRLRDVPAVAVRIEPLTAAEVCAYVAGRFAPAERQPGAFTPGALELIARMSAGVPRAIDALCVAALGHANAHGEASVTPTTVLAVWRARAAKTAVVPAAPAIASPSRRAWLASAVAVPLVFAVLLLGLGLVRAPRSGAPALPAVAAAPAQAPALETVPVAAPAVAAPLPAPRPDARPFARRVGPGRWALQVAATRDAAAAAAAREQLARRGLEAVVVSAVVGEATWQRVLVGPYATRADAEEAAAALGPLP